MELFDTNFLYFGQVAASGMKLLVTNVQYQLSGKITTVPRLFFQQ